MIGALTGTSVAVWMAWQVRDRKLNQFLVENFTLSEWSTIEQGRLQTVLLYPLCHSSTLHLLSNLATYLTLGRAIELIEGGSILIKLAFMAGPLGFALAHSLRSSGNTSTTSLQSLRGGGCLSSAFSTYFLARYWNHPIGIGKWSVPGRVLALALVACEGSISYFWVGNRTIDLELGGALAAAYFIFAQRMIIHR